VVLGVLTQVVCEISPAATNTDHDPLAFTDETNEELDGLLAAGLGKVIQLDFGLVCSSRSSVR
jgi:hypothetical protein